jgi:hypothetical protein
MATGMMEGAPVGAELPEILQVIEGTLVVDTNDLATAEVALKGFQYLLALEFARQQPALALLYNLDIQVMEPEYGTIHFPFKIRINLKERVAAEFKKLKKIEVIAIFSAMLMIPTAIKDSEEIYRNFFKSTETRLLQDLPSCSPRIENMVIRVADSTDIIKKAKNVFDRNTPGNFEF